MGDSVFLAFGVPPPCGAKPGPCCFLGYVRVCHGKGCLLVGHSLGGGIASYAAAQNGQNAATIYPAPINPVWLALPLPPWPARGTKVQNYVCSGEILTVAATLSPNLERIGTDVWIQSNGGSPVDKHGLDQVRT